MALKTVNTYGISANTIGAVTDVSGTAPVVSSGGSTPAISMPAANASTDGYLKSTDWTTFNNKGSGTVSNVATGTGLTGGPITTTGTVSIANTAVSSGVYGNSSTVGQFTVNAQGQLTAAANVAISASAIGAVTNVATGTGLTGGPITSTGTVSLANTAVTAGIYGNSTTVGQFTVDAQGRITAASNVAIVTGGSGTVTNVATGTGLTGGPITSTGTISIANTAVSSGIYGNATTVGQFTVNPQGQLTQAANVAISSPTLGNTALTLGSTVATVGNLTVNNVTIGSVSTPVTVAQGGTGVSTLTAYAVICGGTTTTGAVQSIASVGTSGQVLMSNGASSLPTMQGLGSALEFVIDGGGSALTTGFKGFLESPFACTINRGTLIADVTGNVVIDVWKSTYANAPPVAANTIVASAPLTITSAKKSQDSTLTGWTTSIAAGDILGFNVNSAATITNLLVSLKVTRTGA